MHRATAVTNERRVTTTIASYLPTGLLDQVQDAVQHEGRNPRLPRERLGIYLCLRFTGLHTLPELPTVPGSATVSQLTVQAFSRVANAVDEHGGELLRITGDMALAMWPLAPASEPGKAQSVESLEPAAMRMAAGRASAAALSILENVDELCLWRPESEGGVQPGELPQKREVVEETPEKTNAPSPFRNCLPLGPCPCRVAPHPVAACLAQPRLFVLR